VKKAVCILWVFLTSVQLSGGYAIAAAFAPFSAHTTTVYEGRETVSPKHYHLFHFLNQLLNEKEIEEDFSKLFGHPAFISQSSYSFVPDFSVQNKHFLIHYAASIKGKLPTLYLLHNIFRL
jgi:hypothetical protein